MSKIPLVLLVALVIVVGIHSLTSVNQDIGRHLTLGKIIWETHHVPHTNYFSYTWPDFLFIDHHWFAEVLLFLGEQAVGLKGLIVVKAILLATAFSLALFAVRKQTDPILLSVVGLVSLTILIERTDVRPELISFVIWSWYLFVLFGKRTNLFWTLPLAQIVWVNSHIYFFMGPLVFLLFFFQEYLDAGSIPDKRWLLTGSGVLVANLINPSFFQGAVYPFFVFRNYGYTIVENKSPFFLQAFGYPQLTTNAVWVGIVLFVASTVARLQTLRKRIAPFMLGITTAIFAFIMIRNFPLFALALMPIVLGNLSETAIRFRGVVPTAFISIILLASIYSVVSGQVNARLPMLGGFGLHVPAGSQSGVDFVRSQGLSGPIFNNFDIGSFLIWKLPEEKVFIDGRPEAYPADFIQNTYIKMQEDPIVWERERKRYDIRLIFWNTRDITPWSQAFVARMRKDQAWKVAFEDGGTLILVPRR